MLQIGMYIFSKTDTDLYSIGKLKHLLKYYGPG